MGSLHLTFADPTGTHTSIAVERERFLIGRHSDCDLTISDSRLSREHLLIEKGDERFVATDLGSSNGTDLNYESIIDQTPLNNGDLLSLGGFEIKVEITIADDLEPPIPAAEPHTVAATEPVKTAAPQSNVSQSVSTKFLVISGVIGFVILLVLGMFVILSLRGGSKVNNSNFVYSIDPNETPALRKTPDSTPAKSGNDLPVNGATPSPEMGTTTIPTPANIQGDGNTEKHAAAFLRKIAQNDPNAFVTGGQARIIDAKIKSVSGSSALVDNLASARKNAAAIKSLAASKNLKPQFIAVAAITSLGNSRGDVLQKATQMADTLDKFSTQIGNEFGDDCLLIIAGHGQGDPIKMRNMLQSLATTATESSRTIRTIWYLKEVGKITDSEYDFALRFLSIGTIAQNPKDFGVNTEGLNF